MAGTVAVSSDRVFPNVREITIHCTGDSSDGSIPDTDLVALDGYEYGTISGWGITRIETVPDDTTAPDAADLYLKSSNGGDYLAGYGVGGISASDAKIIYPEPSVIHIGGELYLDVDNQNTASAEYDIIIQMIR